VNNLKGNVADFTSGSIPKHLIQFSVPLFLGNLLQTLYNTVDTIWVGKFLGPNALGAVSVSFPIIFVLVSLVTGITMATTVLVGQYKGADDEDMVSKTIDTSMFLITVAGIVMSIVGVVLHKQILSLMNTPDELFEMASGYLNITFLGLVFVFGYNTISSILRGLGDSKTPLLFLFYTTLINIILDPVFIFGLGPIPRMGINGAALATVLAQAVSFYLSIRYLNKAEHLISVNLINIKFDKEITKKIFTIGLPAGIQQAVVALGATVVMSIVNTFGPIVVAAYGAANKIESFSFMPSMSFGLASSALTAQNIGAGKFDRVKEILKWSSIMAMTVAAVGALIVSVFPKTLLAMFTNDVNVLNYGAGILKILVLSYVPFSMMFVTQGIIRGAGDTFITMVISVFSLWLVRVPLAYYLSKFTSLQSNGIWVAISISSVISAVLHLIYYFTGRWRKGMITTYENDYNEISELIDKD
jgi:putative MATE family efflux protein